MRKPLMVFTLIYGIFFISYGIKAQTISTPQPTPSPIKLESISTDNSAVNNQLIAIERAKLQFERDKLQTENNRLDKYIYLGSMSLFGVIGGGGYLSLQYINNKRKQHSIDERKLEFDMVKLKEIESRQQSIEERKLEFEFEKLKEIESRQFAELLMGSLSEKQVDSNSIAAAGRANTFVNLKQVGEKNFTNLLDELIKEKLTRFRVPAFQKNRYFDNRFKKQSFDDLKKTKDELANKLLNPEMINSAYFDNNLIAIGIGEKITNGKPTGVLAIKFFVEVKQPLKNISDKKRYPEIINGLPVDVEKTDIIKPYTSNFTSLLPNPGIKIRPIKAGCSIGPNNRTISGTLGALVKDKTGDLYILSNNHVLENNSLAYPSDLIFQPSLSDQGDSENDVIARFSKAIKPDPGKYKNLDCAIAKLVKTDNITNEILQIGAPAGIEEAEIDMIVHKYGRGSEYTVGTVRSIETTTNIYYPEGRCCFYNQLFIQSIYQEPFSKAGDSGAIVLNKSQKAIGLLTGGSTNFSVASDIDSVLSSLGVELVL